MQGQLFHVKITQNEKGDVMNINVDELVDFFVDSQNYFKGEMGEIKGNACVKLTKRLN